MTCSRCKLLRQHIINSGPSAGVLTIAHCKYLALCRQGKQSLGPAEESSADNTCTANMPTASRPSLWGAQFNGR